MASTGHSQRAIPQGPDPMPWSTVMTRSQTARVNARRWMLPIVLAVSAATLFTVAASGEEPGSVSPVPRLVCESGKRVITFFDYATTIEEYPVSAAPADTAEQLIDGPLVNGQLAPRELVQLTKVDGELPVVAYRTDGAAAAVVYFEGNERYGWRPARAEACS